MKKKTTTIVETSYSDSLNSLGTQQCFFLKKKFKFHLLGFLLVFFLKSTTGLKSFYSNKFCIYLLYLLYNL